MTNPFTRAMADFAAGLQYRAIPAEVRERIKLLMLDSLGCALYGAQPRMVPHPAATLGELDTAQACAVWGTPSASRRRTPRSSNGTQVQGFELDDVHRAGRAARGRRGAAGAARRSPSCAGN